ncbi:hypothetical protein B0A48_16011 [Cryoendolithus antarcticus]|uniref:Polyadenylate-binding protein-interacting protein 7 n=1 Tax=Cryoendolithus antarcticus TaxID=1507870 RepID=A0A1V8SFS4_9PEZI|nr:hypothetical protein B0A48_16011 [Cryoendolithus antarcticus]
MVSERIYELCEPILEDAKLADEEKTDKLEELLSGPPSSLKGKALEDAVLGALWKYKSAGDKKSSPPPLRGANVIRSRSPAPWIQRSGTPMSGSSSPRLYSATPAAPPGFGPRPTALERTMSSQGSPFNSPKPSPRLPISTPAIPHSPRLSTYQFSDSSPSNENYGDYGSDIVDGLVNDDAGSNASFGDGSWGGSSEFMTPYTTDMSPYDMLRSILQDNRSDAELEQVLEANGYDLSQTINALIEAQDRGAPAMAVQQEQQSRTILIGKNMDPASRPVTPLGQQRSPIICRYWLASGHCARADCRFAHTLENHLCKFWMQGNCLAGNLCQFSHDPSVLMQQLSIANSGTTTPQYIAPNFQLTDIDSFPALQPQTSNPYEDSDPIDPETITAVLQHHQQQMAAAMPTGLYPNFIPTGPRNSSRPTSRHTSRAPTPGVNNNVNFTDEEAFPTLGSAAAAKPGKRHHGKRGGHGHHSTNPVPIPQPSSLADIVRLSPSPAASPSARDAMRRGLHNNRSFTSTRENSSASLSIPAPTQIPWLETGDKVNQAYLRARAEAVRHGGLRNKFLQSAAQAWNRNDARGAKALSLRGQNENALMREAHREAARALYEDRNSHLSSASGAKELYVDLHGLHAEEAVAYLSDCLLEHQTSSRALYAITGTGHHSKNGKDKVGKTVRAFLVEWRYAFREFSVPGDRGGVGGILGVDPSSYDRSVAREARAGKAGDGDSGVDLGQDTKVLLAKEDPRKRMGSGEREEEVLESGS